MDFIQVNNDSIYQIQAYQPGRLTINQCVYQLSVLVSAKNLSLWRPQTLTELSIDDLISLSALKADVILLGVGEAMCFLKAELQRFIGHQCLPIEIMTTDAACRTFQVLTAEQRLVYAALFL